MESMQSMPSRFPHACTQKRDYRSKTVHDLISVPNYERGRANNPSPLPFEPLTGFRSAALRLLFPNFRTGTVPALLAGLDTGEGEGNADEREGDPDDEVGHIGPG